MKLTPEVITNAGKRGRRLGRARRPRALKIILQFLSAYLRDGNQTNVRPSRRQGIEVAVIRLTQVPLHVRLAGTHPHFADEHVLHRAFICSFDDERCGLGVGGQGVELDHPPAGRRIGNR